jgi:hypothetical protein
LAHLHNICMITLMFMGALPKKMHSSKFIVGTANRRPPSDGSTHSTNGPRGGGFAVAVRHNDDKSG